MGKALGALALQTTLNFHQYVETTMTYGSPGLFSKDLRNCQHLTEQHSAKVHMFFQEKDLIPAIDCVATQGINYYLIKSFYNQNRISAHVSMYSTQEKSTITPIDSTIEAKRWTRLGLTIARTLASVFIFPSLLSIYMVLNTLSQIQKLLIKIVYLTREKIKIAIEKNALRDFSHHFFQIKHIIRKA